MLKLYPQIMSSPQQPDEVSATLSVLEKVDGPTSNPPRYDLAIATYDDHDAQGAVMTKIDLMIIPLVGVICRSAVCIHMIITHRSLSDFLSFLVSRLSLPSSTSSISEHRINNYSGSRVGPRFYCWRPALN